MGLGLACAPTHTHTQTYTCRHTQRQTQTPRHSDTDIYTHMHADMHTDTDMHVETYTHTHTNIYTYTHTCTQTHRDTWTYKPTRRHTPPHVQFPLFQSHRAEISGEPSEYWPWATDKACVSGFEEGKPDRVPAGHWAEREEGRRWWRPPGAGRYAHLIPREPHTSSHVQIWNMRLRSSDGLPRPQS